MVSNVLFLICASLVQNILTYFAYNLPAISKHLSCTHLHIVSYSWGISMSCCSVISPTLVLIFVVAVLVVFIVVVVVVLAPLSVVVLVFLVALLVISVAAELTIVVFKIYRI